MTSGTFISPEELLTSEDANLSIFGGYRTLVVEVDRNLFGGQRLLRLLSKDPAAPRRKPVNLLRAAGIADVWVGAPDQSAADLLRTLADMIDKASGVES